MDIEFCDFVPVKQQNHCGMGGGGGGVTLLIETEHLFRGLRACFGVMLFPPCP